MRPTLALFVGKYRHLRLTTKDVKKGFYKGNRTGAMGRHTNWGGYKIEWNRVRTYVVPEKLAEFPLTPFVPQTIAAEKDSFIGVKGGARSPQLYLDTWKEENGVN